MKSSIAWLRFSLAVALSMMILDVGIPTLVAAEGDATQEAESRNGLALFAGVTDDDQETAFTLGVPVFLHPNERSKLFVAPGAEHREDENNFLVRLGAGYSFDVGPVDLEPSFMVDFVDEDEVTEVFILGLALVWEL